MHRFVPAMKKGLIVILTLSYLVFSVGIINFSVLCLKLNQQIETETMAALNKSDFCGKCGKCILNPTSKKESGCCKNKTEFHKVDIAQSLAKSNVQLNVEQFALLQAILPLMGFYQVAEPTDATFAHQNSPPTSQTVPINVLNCVYRI